MGRLDNFNDYLDKSKEELSDESIEEARDKIDRLQTFYQDPYEDGSERWFMAEFALDYLMQFKVEGSKRKDGITEDILHEINQLLLQRSLIKASIANPDLEVIPRRITTQIVDGNEFELPYEMQSAERLFVATTLHDVDEDFHDSSPDHYRDYIKQRIAAEDSISDKDKEIMLEELEVDVQTMKLLTFGRKTRDSEGNPTKEKTYEGDRNKYMDAVEIYWAAAATKATDKLDSLTSRYGLAETYFTIEQDLLHIDETHRLFKQRQIMENMADKYPQMADYFELINAKLDVADRCLEGLTLYHPAKLALNPDAEVNPETAKIDIRRPLDKATMHAEYLERDSWMLMRMLRGFQVEAETHPELQNVVDQMVEQYEAAVASKNYPKPPIYDDRPEV